MPATLPIIIGMTHLAPLPGSPRYGGTMDDVRSAMFADARALADAGFHGVMVENFGDAPFFPGRAPAATVAAMAALLADLRREIDLPVGVNVLRNDGQSALAIAAATEAAFIRVNVLTGARLTDQGVVQGIAHDLLRDRAALRAERVAIVADVNVKHSAPLADRDLAEQVADLVERGGADGVVVSGSGTGRPADMTELRQVRSAAGDTPVYLGSGATADNLADYLPHLDGLIVGTAIKRNGRPAAPVDPDRARAFMQRYAELT